MRTTLFCGSFTTRPRTESGASAPLLQRSTQLFQKEYEIPFRRSRRCKTVHLRIAPTAATNFGEEGLSTNQGSLLGPPPPSSNGSRLQSRGNGPVTTDIEEVKLESDVGYDWQPLKTFLKEKDFQKADDETRAALIQLAGEEAQSQRYVYWTQVKFIPKKDLQTIDALWRAASGNKFGYSVQKEIFRQSGQQWTKFFQQIGWVHGQRNNYKKWPQEFTYSLDAPKGHLPLTNTLRGQELFLELLQHPAFEGPAPPAPQADAPAQVPTGGSGIKFTF